MIRTKCLCIWLVAFFAILTIGSSQPAPNLNLDRIPDAKPRNIIFILADDHRYDAMGFMGHPFLETPHMDFLATNGVHLKNAFVTTSLCSPSRASILTGLYAHKHRVVDNLNPIAPNTVFFSQYLKKAGYETAFFGKWHMGGDNDNPKPGFDRWVSFRGQGTYQPTKAGLNVDGKRVERKGYITDELTDYAVDWLESRKLDKPFMAYISHKAVHADFEPAERHKGRYKDKKLPTPPTQAEIAEADPDKPMWLKNQRNSWHGVDYPYHGQLQDISQFYISYCETLLAVDEGIGRVLDFLRKKNLLENTIVVYMGDNGFLFGEHGLIDKRVAYEESMRVPLLMHCPQIFKPGTVVEQVVANIDIAPTFLEAAGLKTPEHMDGTSFLPVARGESIPWRDALLYEYYWERTFPQTPTMHAVRGDQYKYIRYQGLWDTDELYDLKADPSETRNLIRSPEHKQVVAKMNKQMFDILEETDGMYMPLNRDRGGQNNLRSEDGSETADFPPHLVKPARKVQPTDAAPKAELNPPGKKR
ncbi:MAG: sulfatase [Verrucomicrobia bacterium]|nr:sulfatase [Verrucomicrobiota bacterium]